MHNIELKENLHGSPVEVISMAFVPSIGDVIMLNSAIYPKPCFQVAFRIIEVDRIILIGMLKRVNDCSF